MPAGRDLPTGKNGCQCRLAQSSRLRLGVAYPSNPEISRKRYRIAIFHIASRRCRANVTAHSTLWIGCIVELRQQRTPSACPLFLAPKHPWQNNAEVLQWRRNANISRSWNSRLSDRDERSSQCAMGKLSRSAYSANG